MAGVSASFGDTLSTPDVGRFRNRRGVADYNRTRARSADDEPQQACSEQRGRSVEKQVDFLYELREFSVFIRSRAVSSPARERLLSQVPSIVC